MEEEFVEKMCNEVIAMKPDLVITEKGVSDLAQHYLVKAGISVIRRVRKSDNNRIGRSVILATLFLSKPPISLVMIKPVFGVSDQVRYEPGCTTTENG